MKIILLAFTFALLIFPIYKIFAQEKIEINIEKQPLWGPSGFSHVDYYYIPEIQTYYSVVKRKFIYLSDGRWLFSNHLPPKYISFNLYKAYKVILNKTSRPYLQFTEHKEKYNNFKSKRSEQICIKDSKDPRFSVFDKRAQSKKVIKKKPVQSVKKEVIKINHKIPVKPVLKFKPKIKIKSFSH